MKNNSNIPLVFVETGRRPSKYLINNIHIIKERFPGRKIILIVNKKYINMIMIEGIEKVAEEEIVNNSNLSNFESIQKNWSGLQKNYWTNTTKRFFILGKFMDQHQFKQLVHLESDCILLNDKWLNEEFQKSNWGIKYTKQHEIFGCASILIINKLEIFNKFLTFIIDNWSRGEITDMNLLGEFIDKEPQASFLSSGNLIESSSTHIYDAGSIGQFFLGGEARNQRLPFSSRGHRDASPGSLALINPKVKLNRFGVLVYTDKDLPELELMTLHIHSKKIPRSYKRFEKKILRDSRNKRGAFWQLGAFDQLVFLERLVSFIGRRVFRKKLFEFRLR